MRDEIIAKNFAKRPTVPLAELARVGVPTLTHAIEQLLDHPTADDVTAPLQETQPSD
jgi:hypothetical protein